MWGPPSDPTFLRTSLTVTATVSDAGGALVKTLDAGSHRQMDHWQWDGTDTTGALVAPGVYTATVGALTSSGLSGSATVPITVQADGPPPPPCQFGGGGAGAESRTVPQPGRSAVHVNTGSGNYFLSAQDFQLPSAGIPLDWTRYYNSQCSGSGGPFGPGWTFSYDERLVPSGDRSTVTHILEDGQQIVYTGPVTQTDGSLLYDTPRGTTSRLHYDPNTDRYKLDYCTHGCDALFNGQGQLIQLRDPQSRAPEQQVVDLTYDGNGLTGVSATNAMSQVVRTLTVTSDPTTGVISAVEDQVGRTWSYNYTSGYLTSVTDPLGHVTRYQYGSIGGISGLSASAMRVTARNALAVRARLPRGDAAVTTAHGDATALRPRTRSALIARAPMMGALDTTGGTGAQSLTGVQDQSGGVTTIGYDGVGRAISVQDPLGNTTSFSYTTTLTGTSRTGVTTATVVTDPLGGTQRDYYDDHGRLRQSVDAAGVDTSYGVDYAYDQIGTTVAGGAQGAIATNGSYDDNGDQTSSVDGAGDLSVNSYDDKGDLLTATDALGNQTTNGYDADGNQITSADTLGRTTVYTYDAAGDQTGSTDPQGHTTHTDYDALGHPLTVTDALGDQTSYGYDSLGRTIAVTDPLGRVTRYGYDALGHTVAVTDALGNATHSAYNSAGQLVSSTDALGGVTSYGYDSLGDTIAMTDALGNVARSYYDQDGRLISQTDALGAITMRNRYDKAGQLVERGDALGHRTAFAYDTAGRLVTQTDAAGNTTSYGYDALGNTIAVTDALGDVTQSAYDGDGRLITQEDALGEQTTYGYDSLGQTVAVTDALGDVTRSGYDAAGQLVTGTDALGNQTTYGYDALGRTIAVTDPLGGVTRSGYDADGEAVTATDALGRQTLTAYDPLGRVAAVTDATGHATRNAYDAGGRLVSSTDALGDVTRYGYDLLGRTVAVTDAAGGVTQSGYDADGRLVTSTDPLGNRTIDGYDALGETIAVTDPLGGVTRISYDALGRAVSSTDMLGHVNQTGYDALGRTVAVTDADGRVTQTAYDPLGHAVAVTDALGYVTQTGYDGLGRTVAVTDALGNTTGSGYDADGRLVTSTDALGNQTLYGYDALGRTVAVTDTLGNVTASRYDADGELLTSTDPLGRSTGYGYDALGRTVRVTDALGNVTASAYDAAGRLLTATDALGNRTVYGYDPLGRSIAVTDALGDVTHSAYDPAGRLITSTDALGATTRYGYDALGRTVAVTDALGRVTHSAYDLDGRLLSSADALGNQTLYGYDGVGQTVDVTDALGGVTTSAYDADGRLISSADALGHATRYGYDALGRAIVVTDADGHATTTGYDADGRGITSADALGDTTWTGYDALGRTIAVTDALWHVTTTGYDAAGEEVSATDALGNMTRTGYDALGRAVAVTDALGHLSQTGYDALGRTVAVTNARGNATWTGYDALGRTISVTDALGAVTRSAYDADGRLVTATDALGGRTVSGYDLMGETVAVTDALGHVTHSQYDAGGRLLTATDALGNATGYGYDALGHTVVVTDARGDATHSYYDLAGHLVSSTDALGGVQRYSYDPAGQRTAQTDQDNRTTGYGYDPAGRLITTTDPLGHSTIDGLDALGRTVRVTDATGRYTATRYDAAGRVIQTDDGLGHLTRTQYDALGQPIIITDGAGRVTTQGYDAAGNQVTSADGLGDTTATGYDALGRAVAVTNPDGNVTRTGYDALGRTVVVTDPAGDVASYGYDALGHTIAVTDPNGHARTQQYDADGRLTASTDALGRDTSYGYDALGNAIVVTDGNGHVARTSYDGKDEPLTTAYTDGSAVTRTYDPAGQRLTLDTKDTQLTWGYDGAGRVTALTETVGGLGAQPLPTRTPGGQQAGMATRAMLRTSAMSGVTVLGHTSVRRASEVARTPGRHQRAAAGAGLRAKHSPGVHTTQRARHLHRDRKLTAAGTAVAGVTARSGRAARTLVASRRLRRGHSSRVPRPTARTIPATSHHVDAPQQRTTSGANAVVMADAPTATDTPIPPAPTVPIANSSFETPSLGTGTNAYQYNPTGGSWTFSGNTGVAANGSAFFVGDPGVPDGTQAAFIQRVGSFQQDIGPFQAGVGYAISFQAIQRAGQNEDFTVYLDNTLLGTFRPTGTAYATYTTAAFQTSAGAHTLTFVGLDSAGGDNTAFIDAVRVVAGVPVANSGFETPSLGTGTNAYQYDPTGAGWTFSGNAGVAANGSAFFVGGPSAPDGAQVGFVQTTGSMQQDIGPFQAGVSYAISFFATQRAGQSEDFTIYLDNTPLATFRPSGGIYAAYTTALFQGGAGTHTLKIVGVDSAGGDNTVLIDDVRVVAASLDTIANGNFEAQSVGSGITAYQYNPTGAGWTFTGGTGVAANGSTFFTGDPTAPDGTQVAFLQRTGSMQQVIGPFQAGTSYAISFQAIQRAGQNQDFALYLDSVPLGTFRPTGSTYATYTTGAFLTATGTHTLMFVALDSSGGDNTAFVDAVRVVPGTGPVMTPGPTATPTARPTATATPLTPVPTATPRACPCSIWNGQETPAEPSHSDASPIEVGMKFRADMAGDITGIRFYKGNGNTGAHVAHLWAGDGTLLATAAFTSETASGWQQVSFATPVAVAADTTYVASYHTTTGYGVSTGYFATGGVDSPPLHALADGADGANGVYVYGGTSFPTQTSQSTNYWVDVVYSPAAATPTPTNTPMPTATPASTALPSATVTPTTAPTTTATAMPSPAVLRLGYSYDAAGRRITETFPDGQTAGWGYDAAGQVSLLTGADGLTSTVTRDGAGDLTSLSAPNGGIETWRYDAAGRLTGTAWLSGTTTLFSQTATLDAAGQRRTLSDSWGTTTYGYDPAGRLVSASYPDGTGEQDRYDAAGNRLVVTSTGGISGTTITSNRYDAADELLTSTDSLAGATTYNYDGNGNQTGSVGPGSATTTNSYNDLNQLVGVSGPSGSASYVSDGQGDRLGAVTQTGAQPGSSVQPLAQDLAAFDGGAALTDAGGAGGGLSALASDGTQDYLYLQPGSGQAPLAAYNPTGGQSTYLATDLGGSVRLAADGSNNVVGAAAYDAWGTARPTTADSAGQTLLAGVQGATPFGYAGQYRDAATGAYDMRAREYDPAQVRFLSVDPLLAQTGQPYQYAGDDPIDRVDPSGQAYDDFGCATGDVRQETAEAAVVRTTLFYGGRAACNATIPGLPAVGAETVVDDQLGGQLWVVAPLEQLLPTGYVSARARAARDVAALQGHRSRCRLYAEQTQGLFGLGGTALVRQPVDLSAARLGTSFDGARGPVPVQTDQSAGHPPANLIVGQLVLPGGGVVPGVLFYQSFTPSQAHTCVGGPNVSVGQVLHCGYQFVVGDDLDVLRSQAGWLPKVVAVVDLGSNALVLVPLVGDGARLGVKALAKVALSAALKRSVAEGDLRLASEVGVHVTESDVATLERGAQEGVGTETREPRLDTKGGCTCFAAGTLVATPTGKVAIDKLHKGQRIWAEDPRTGRVEAEIVQATITDGIKPLIAVILADGTRLRVTADHPFWVDGGKGIAHAGWLPAGQLRPGDRLRTASGKDVLVVRVRRDVGRARVYTLTVAHDHTFFVGHAHVLVHNSGHWACVIESRPEDSVWNKTPDKRGIEIERSFLGREASFDGKHSQNYPVIDDFVKETGVATSIKSIDLTDKTYHEAWRVSDLLKKYAKKLNKFDGTTWDGITIEPGAIRERVLAVALEDGAASKEQAAAIKRFEEWTTEKEGMNVKVVIKYIK